MKGAEPNKHYHFLLIFHSTDVKSIKVYPQSTSASKKNDHPTLQKKDKLFRMDDVKFDQSLYLVSTIFYFFHLMMVLQKLWKMLFISSKELSSFLRFSRYSNFCISFLPSFTPSHWRLVPDPFLILVYNLK